MIFDTNRVASQYADQPDYASGDLAKKLALAGYKPNGEQNTWGKISSWIPGFGLAYNYAGRSIAKKGGASDTFDAIKSDTDNRWKKLGLEAGIATAAFGGLGALGAIGGAGAAGAGGLGGAIAANSGDLISAGLKTGLTFGGSLAFDQGGGNVTNDSNYYYM